jgi:hypothetical protein
MVVGLFALEVAVKDETKNDDDDDLSNTEQRTDEDKF